MSSPTRLWIGLVPALAVCAPAWPGVVATLSFENITTEPYPADPVDVMDYYNGGAAGNGNTGPNYGVVFSGGSTICMNTPGTDSCNASRGSPGPSQWYGFFWETGTPIMSVAAGFEVSLSFLYSNAFGFPATVEVYSSEDAAAGTLLASLDLQATPAGGCSDAFAGGAFYCPLVGATIAFSGTARSVKFVTDDYNLIVFDDIRIPAPAPWSLLALGAGLAAAGAGRRQHRSVDAARAA